MFPWSQGTPVGHHFYSRVYLTKEVSKRSPFLFIYKSLLSEAIKQENVHYFKDELQNK